MTRRELVGLIVRRWRAAAIFSLDFQVARHWLTGGPTSPGTVGGLGACRNSRCRFGFHSGGLAEKKLSCDLDRECF